ncbi:hypothetical protein Glove_173g52 [Diversispora epigaea]|uniref:Uncharacterized protein n=1 Tax=Diversispora epigaea TaxID=1348612 RepID=A0A397IXH2_9GLOM|nr:hypothetical protein Glove_173g52 [Diversispora epigaea]
MSKCLNVVVVEMSKDYNDAKRSSGRPLAGVWNYFEKGESKKAHLAFNCLNNNKEVIQFYSKVFMDRSETSQAVSSDPKLSSKKKKTSANQSSLSDFMESTKLTPEQENAINLSILKVFIMCNIPFHIIKNPYFIDALREL